MTDRNERLKSIREQLEEGHCNCAWPTDVAFLLALVERYEKALERIYKRLWEDPVSQEIARKALEAGE